MNPKTLLVNHPDPPHVDLFSGRGRCEPLPLTYLAAYLRKHKFPVEILDANVLGLTTNAAVREIKKRKPDIVGLSAVTPNFTEAVKIAQKIKKIKNPPLTIIGGPHISAIPSEIVKYPFFDLAVLGEGEKTLLEIIVQVKRGEKNFGKIKGVAFRENQKLITTQPRPYLKNLDKIPFPARDLLPPLDLYHPTPGMYRRLPVAFMITSRGCPFQCIFCSHVIFGHHYRVRSPKNVVDEMEMLVKKFGVKEIRICDDIFNLNEKRVLDICRDIIKRKLDLSWGCSGRANCITPRMLRALKKAGCWEICYGIESGNEKVRQTIKKGLDLKTIQKAISLTRNHGLDTRGFFMFGLPGDTLETMKETVNVAKKLSLSVANFYITMPYPGTELTKKAAEFGKIDKPQLENYLSQTTNDPPFVPFGLTKNQIVDYYHKGYKEFYVRPSFLLYKLMGVRSLTQLHAYAKAFFSILKNFWK